MEKILNTSYRVPGGRLGFQADLCARTKEEVEALKKVADLLEPFGIGFSDLGGNQAVLEFDLTLNDRGGSPADEFRKLVEDFDLARTRK